MDEQKKMIEAALFIAAKPVSLAEIYRVVKIPKPKIKKIIDSMTEYYERHSFHIVESDGLYEIRIKPEFENRVGHLAPHQDFSKAILQTLSVITYKNPVKQSNVIDIRGNRAYDHLNELEGKGFIRREPYGHTNLIHITRKFLDYFGLKDESELKTYFSSTNIDKVLTEVDVEENKEKERKRAKVDRDAPPIDARDIAISPDGELPEKLQELLEKKKENLLKKRKPQDSQDR